MPTTLRLLCHAATTATRRALVPGDEPIEESGRGKAVALAATLGRVDIAWTSPTFRAKQTADALGLRAKPDSMLRDLDLDSWTGRTVADLEAQAPDALMSWTKHPASAPHGGEPVLHLMARTRSWMRLAADRSGRMVAVTHAAVIRATVLVVRRQPSGASTWRRCPASPSPLRRRDGNC